MIKISENTKNNYWVYLVKSASGDIIYIGANRLKDAITLNGFNYQPTFDPQAEYEIELLESFKDRQTAIKAQQSYFMLYGIPVFNCVCRRIVRCTTTGETFKTATEACRKYGIEQSNMTHHLNGQFGFNRLKGLEFRYEVQNDR